MSVWPAWEVREGERVTRWLHVRLAFADGASVEALATVSEQCVCVEDVRARPALSLDDLALFADWIEGPLARACGADAEPGPEYRATAAGRSRRAARPRPHTGRASGTEAAGRSHAPHATSPSSACLPHLGRPRDGLSTPARNAGRRPRR